MLKLKYLWALLLLPLIWLILMASVAIPAIGHAKSYIKVVQGDYSAQSAKSSADLLTSDINRAFALLNVPIAKQISSLLGVNFSSIKDEIQAGIATGAVLVGADKPKKYLIAFQNSAEARGTGGILGAYAIVELKKGSLKVIETGSNEPLYGSSLEKIPIDVPEEYKRLYGENPAILQNSNLSPHFPYGAEIWLALWKKEFDQTLDGVIAIDPTALSYILRSTGPITLNSGERLTSDNLVSDTLKDAYERFEKDNKARKQYLVDIMNATVKQLNSGTYSKIKMAQAIRDGIVANRILFYSTNKSAQTKLSKVRLGGFMALESNNEFRTVIQNIDAGKLDYYLDRDVIIESKTCEKIRETQVRIRVTNTLKTGVGVSPYVLTRADKGKPASLIPGSHRFKVFIYGPTDAKLVSVSRENRTANLGGGSTERGRPIYVADVDLAPGASEKLLANFSGGVGKVTFVDQPLVQETKINIKDRC
jgi:translation initiation factor IF-1